MIQEDYDYIQGSAARQLEYDVYENNTVLRAKKRYRNNRKVKFRLVMSILAVLTAGLVVMYRFAAITKISYSIDQKQNQYAELKNENSLLKVQIETETSLTDIKETAELKLNMQTPDKSQIVYIKVPRNDYTVVVNGQDKAGGGNIIAFFIKKAAGLIGLFE